MRERRVATANPRCRRASAPPAARSTPRCASCRARSARRCSRSIRSAARSTTSPIDRGRARARVEQLEALARRHRRDLRRAARRRARAGSPSRSRLRPAARGLPRRDRRHGDGRRRRHPRAGLANARPLLRPRRERGRAAVGARVRHGARRRASRSPIISAARCSSPTSCATRRGRRRSGGSICRARRCSEAGIADHRPGARCWQAPRLGKACAQVVARARRAFRRGRRDHGAQPAPRRCSAPRIMAAAYRVDPRRLIARGWHAPRDARSSVSRACASSGSFCATRSSDGRARVHIIGAGLAGLAAAVAARAARASASSCTRRPRRPAGAAAPTHDPQLGMTIDNGNHLLLSGNHAALAYLDAIGARRSPGRARRRPSFPFVDLKTGERWTLRVNDGVDAVVDVRRRAAGVPGTTRARLSRHAARCCARRRRKPIGEVIDCAGPLYDRLLEPLLLAALNTDPPEGSARLAGARHPRDAAAGGASLPSADRARGPVASA